MPAGSKPQSAGAGDGLLFVVVGHPDELRDKQRMRANRKHVMFNYLGKERQRPDSTDARVTGSAQARKRKRLAVPETGISTNASAPNHIFQDPSRLTPAPSTYSNASSSDSRDGEKNCGSDKSSTSPEYARRTKLHIDSQALMRRGNGSTPEPPLVAGFGGTFRNSRYLARRPEEIPFGLGTKLNPFQSWPTFEDPRIDVSELKYSCKCRLSIPPQSLPLTYYLPQAPTASAADTSPATGCPASSAPATPSSVPSASPPLTTTS